MPANISSTFRNALQSAATSMAQALKITLRNGTVYRLTTADHDVALAGEIYSFKNGFEPTNIDSSSEGEASNLDITFYFSDGSFTEDDVTSGRLDGAEAALSWFHFDKPEAGLMTLFRGFVSDIKVSNEKAATATLVGTLARGMVPIGETYTSNCRAVFGDSRCKYDIMAKAYPAVINYISDNRLSIRVSQGGPLADQNFNQGIVQFTGGAQVGDEIDIAACTIYGQGSSTPAVAQLGMTVEFFPTAAPGHQGGPKLNAGDTVVVQFSSAQWTYDKSPKFSPVTVLSAVQSDDGTYTKSVVLSKVGDTADGSLSVGQYIKVNDTRTVSGFDNYASIGTHSANVEIGISSPGQAATPPDDIVLDLSLPVGNGAAVGDAVTLYPGCDKTLSRCKYYSNVVNMRAEPYVPTDDYQGQDPLIDSSGAVVSSTSSTSTVTTLTAV